jgi:hypothetical protein
MENGVIRATHQTISINERINIKLNQIKPFKAEL